MIFLFLIIILHIFLLSRLIFFPYPELFVYPYLTNRGLVPYRDILDQHFPGFMFFPINLDNLGMTTPEIARFWQYGIVVLTHLILFFIARKIFKSSLKALISNFLYLIWQPFFEGWILWIDSFLPLLVLPAFYFSYMWLKVRKNSYIFWAGIFLGIALLFKQVILPLIAVLAFYVILKSKNIKSPFFYGLGVFIPISFLVLYILKLGIWSDFIYWTVTFNLTLFAKHGRKFGTLSHILRVLAVYGFSYFAIFNKKRREIFILISIFLVSLLVTSYARFDFVHFQPSLPFVVLMSVLALEKLSKDILGKVLIAVYIFGTVFLLANFYKGYVGDRIFYFGENEKRIVGKVRELTTFEDKIFSFASLPHIYQTAERLPSGNIFVFQFPWFMMKAEDRVLKAIINDPPKVVIRERASKVDGEKLLIDYMKSIDKYIETNYKVIDNVGGVELMIRK